MCTAQLGGELYGETACDGAASYSLQYDIPTGDGYYAKFYVCARHYDWYFIQGNLKCNPHHEGFKLVYPGDADPYVR
jgi:hypothetical protein